MPERPKDLIYALDERPPPFQLLALGFQHVAVICPCLVMVALVAGAARLPHEAARNAMGLAMIAVAFLTVLQSLRLGRVGSGYLCPPVVSAIYLPSSVTAASTFGFPVACGMVIFAGACEALMAQLLFFNGSLMFVAGIQIVASRPITLRASLIVGFSILTALSIMIFPEFYKSLPAGLDASIHDVLDHSRRDHLCGSQCRLSAGDVALQPIAPGRRSNAAHRGNVRRLLR